MEIKRVGTQASTKGPADWFTGTVRIDPLFQANAPARAAGASVSFEPGARTVWHTHPLGQTLIVTARAFAAAGAAVALADVNEKAVRTAAEELVAAGHKAIGICYDFQRAGDLPGRSGGVGHRRQRDAGPVLCRHESVGHSDNQSYSLTWTMCRPGPTP